MLEQGGIRTAREYADRLDYHGYPDHAHLLRGQTFLRADQINPAVEEINQIPEEATALRLQAAETFGLRFLALGKKAEAEQLFQYVLSRNPDHLNARRGLAAIYFDQGAALKALRHAQEWSRLAPNDGNPHRFMGVIYMDMGDNNNFAVASFKEALALQLTPPQREEVKRELAEVLIRETDYAKAWELLSDLDAQSQRLETVQELKGECLMKLNRTAELKSMLGPALVEFPHSTRLLWLQARLHLDDSKPQEAARLLEQALKVDRHCTRCRQLLAQSYVALGRAADAAEQMRQLEATQKLVAQLGEMTHQAMESPWDSKLRLRLAAVCVELDRFAEATNWRQAAALCPSQPPEAETKASSPGAAESPAPSK